MSSPAPSMSASPNPWSESSSSSVSSSPPAASPTTVPASASPQPSPQSSTSSSVSSSSSSSSSGSSRAHAFILPLPDCPKLEQFVTLLSLADSNLTSANSSVNEAKEDGEISFSSSQSSASLSASDQVELLSRMLDWSRSLFMQHDRALAAHDVYASVVAALPLPSPSTAKSASATASSSSSSSASSSSSSSPFTPLHTRIAQYPFPYVSRVHSELSELKRVCGPREITDPSWRVVSTGVENGSGIATWYRSDPNSSTHSFLVSGIIDSPLFNCVVLVKEVDLFSRWLPAIESVKVIPLDNSRYRMQAHVGVKGIWPFSSRDAVLYGYGDVIDNGVGVYFRSQSSDEVVTGAGADGNDVTVPPCPSSIVRVLIKYGGFWFERINEKQTLVRAIFNLDPMLPIVPYFFLNNMSSRFCGALIERMRKRTRTIFDKDSKGNDSIYSIRLRENARVYDEITRRLKEATREVKRQKEVTEEGTAAVAAGGGAGAAAEKKE